MIQTFVSSSKILLGACAFLMITAPLAVGQTPQTRNVKDFGAKGDGIADDSEAIERASTTVAGTGGVLVCPPGIYLFNPSLHKIVIGNNMTFTGGCLIRVVPNTANYMYIVSALTPVTHVENVVIDGISIDQNTLAPALKARVNDKDIQTREVAILFYNVVNIIVRNTSILSSGIDAIVCNGPAVKGVRIQHNLITFQKRGDQPGFDNSAIYVDGTDFDVSDNVFRSAQGQEATTAIEVHTGTGSVTNNISDWYRSGIIGASTHALEVKGNIITNAERGISLWAVNKATNSDSKIESNIVSLNNKERLSTSPGGILLWHGSESTGAFEGIAITDNIVTFEPEPSGSVSGYDTWGIGLESNGTVNNAQVLRNTVVDAPIRGIKVGAVNGGLVSNVVVTDNTIVNAGMDAAPATSGYRAAIALDGLLNGVEIHGNTITCADSSCQSYGIYGSDQDNNHFHNIRVRPNLVQRSAGREYSLPASVVRSEE